jgi:tetratricopeptide (TPR) repeat protein
MRIQMADVLRRIPGRSSDAESLARAIVKDEPAAANARTLLARILLDKALTARVNDREEEYERFLAESRQVVTAVLGEQRGYGEARLLLGEIEMAAGNLSEAATQLRQVAADDRVYVQALIHLVEVSRQQGNRQTMMLSLVEILKIQPQNMAARIQLADLYARDQAYDRVERLMEEGLGYAPGHPQLTLILCQALLAQKDANKSARALRLATELTQRLPMSPDVWGAWAGAMNAVNRMAEATTKLEELAKQPPVEGPEGSIAFGRMLAKQYLAAERRDDSRKVLDGLLAAHGKSPAAIGVYSDAYGLLAEEQKAGWMGAAADLLERGLKDFPLSGEDSQSLMLGRYLARIYYAEGKVDSARGLMLDVLKVQPQFVAVLVDLGELELGQKNFDAAIERFETAIRLDPNLWGALNNLAWVLSMEKGNLAKAREYIDRALRLQPRHPSLLDTSGWIHYLAGDYRSAERELEQSLLAAPSPITKFHLGMALAKRSEQTSAAAAKAELASRAKALLGEFLGESTDGSHERQRAEAEKVLKAL